MLVALALFSPAQWVTTSQFVDGVSIEAIKNQMQGGPMPKYPGSPQVSPRAELGGLWSYNPNPTTDSERQHGLNDGITFAFDDALCMELLPKFRENILCASVLAALHLDPQMWGPCPLRPDPWTGPKAELSVSLRTAAMT